MAEQNKSGMSVRDLPVFILHTDSTLKVKVTSGKL